MPIGLKNKRREIRSSKKFYGLAILFFAFGLMSKPMLVTVPFLLLLLDFWPLQRLNNSTVKRLLIEKIPFFLLSAAVCVITYHAQKIGGAISKIWASVSGWKTPPCRSQVISENFSGRSTWRSPTRWQIICQSPMRSFQFLCCWQSRPSQSGNGAFARGCSPAGFGFWAMLVPVIGLVQAGDQAMVTAKLICRFSGTATRPALDVARTGFIFEN